MSGPLTDEQMATFERDGFAVLPGFYEGAEVELVQCGVHLLIGLVMKKTF